MLTSHIPRHTICIQDRNEAEILALRTGNLFLINAHGQSNGWESDKETPVKINIHIISELVIRKC